MKAFAFSTEQITLKEALREAVLTLQASHVETASLDARILLEHALGYSREQLLMRVDEFLLPQQLIRFRDSVSRRARRQPVSHLIGKREFFGMTFAVNSSVLDPRPDSEILIESILKRFRNRNEDLRILDLGTGSGCLLLTLLHAFPRAIGVGVDISQDALGVAQENAVCLGLQLRCEWRHSHWCMHVDGQFDIIISNPPYIPTSEIENLAPEVAQYEPKLALDGGEDGLSCYRAVVASLPAHLKIGGIAVLELGFGQQQAVESLALQHGLTPVAIAHDLQGIVRTLILTH